MTKQPIPIFFSTDDNYAPFLAVAIRSLTANADTRRRYRIHILISELSESNTAMLSELGTDNTEIVFADVGERSGALQSSLLLRDYYTDTTYYRFFIADMFPQYDKALYLDCDIAVTGDIAELFDIPLGDCLVGAVGDDVIRSYDVFGRYSERVLGIGRLEYFNAGVLLMNLSAFRREKIMGLFVSMLEKNRYDVAQDQDYLNVICRGRVLLLGSEWNRSPLHGESGNAPKLVHYKLNMKPWHYENVPFGSIFAYYAGDTGYSDILADMRISYSDAEKARDAIAFERLVQLAEMHVSDAVGTTA